MPTIDNKPPSMSIGVDKSSMSQKAVTQQSTAISFADKVRYAAGTGLSGLASGVTTFAAFIPGGGPIIAAAASRIGGMGEQMGKLATHNVSFQGPNTMAGNSAPRETLAQAQASPQANVMASNNAAVTGHSPTFMSILQDSGTGGPGQSMAGNFGVQSKPGQMGIGMGVSAGFSSAAPAGSAPGAIPSGGIGSVASFSSASMGSMGSALSATGAGASALPSAMGAGGGLGSAGSAATGGDAIAGQANATGGSSQAQLMQATQGMQEMQMSFNMQYLQLQNSMQNDNRQFTMVSNIMKTKHDTVKNTISNIH